MPDALFLTLAIVNFVRCHAVMKVHFTAQKPGYQPNCHVSFLSVGHGHITRGVENRQKSSSFLQLRHAGSDYVVATFIAFSTVHGAMRNFCPQRCNMLFVLSNYVPKTASNEGHWRLLHPSYRRHFYCQTAQESLYPTCDLLSVAARWPHTASSQKS